MYYCGKLHCFDTVRIVDYEYCVQMVFQKNEMDYVGVEPFLEDFVFQTLI